MLPDGSGGYAAGLPVPLRRRWRGLGPMETYQPFFTQQLGVITRLDTDGTDAAPFLAALPPLRRAYGQLHYANQLSAPPSGLRGGQRITHHLALDPPYEALAAAFHQNHRRNLRKAMDLLLVEDNGAVGAVIGLFRATKGAALPEIKARHYALLTRLTTQLAARGQLLVLLTRDPVDGALLAGGVFARDARQTIYLLGGVSEAGRARGAMHGVIDGLLRREAGTPGRLLDFEGSMVDSVARFYAGFGARPVPYLTFQRP